MALKVCGAFKEKVRSIDVVGSVWLNEPSSLKLQFASCYAVFQKVAYNLSDFR